MSDPVADARLAALVFRDQWASLKGTGAGAPQLIDFYRFCFEDSLFNGLSGEGLAAFFSAVGARGFESPGAALGSFVENTAGIVCRKAVFATVLPLLGDGARRPALAYCLAWLQVAGASFVLPPWVRYRFPEIAPILTRLRQTPCGDEGCRYCREHHDPETNLERILRALRRAKRNKLGEIVITSDELLRDEDLADLHEDRKEARDTKVKTAIAWLERGGFLSRDENLTEVFQGQPLVKGLDEARAIIATLNLTGFVGGLWLNILRVLFNEPEDRGLSADSIAESLFPGRELLQKAEAAWKLTPAQIVIRVLHDMAEARLIDRGIMLTAILRPKGKGNAMLVLQAVSDLEQRLIALMQAEDPDADDGEWVDLDLRRMAQRLKNGGSEANPLAVRTLVKGLSHDGKGLAAGLGSLELQHLGRDRYKVRLQRSWEAIKKTARLKRDVAYVILKTLIEKAERASGGAGEAPSGDVTLTVSSNELSGAVLADITLRPEIKNPPAAVDRALMFLHVHKAITSGA